MIYFCRLTGPSDLNEGWRWVSRSRLAAGGPLDREDGSPEAPPSDVRVLAKYAFQMVSSDAESQY